VCAAAQASSNKISQKVNSTVIPYSKFGKKIDFRDIFVSVCSSAGILCQIDLKNQKSALQ